MKFFPTFVIVLHLILECTQLVIIDALLQSMLLKKS